MLFISCKTDLLPVLESSTESLLILIKHSYNNSLIYNCVAARDNIIQDRLFVQTSDFRLQTVIWKILCSEQENFSKLSSGAETPDC